MRALDLLRADVVGSLLRPAAWREARAAFDEGHLGEAEFRRIEDDAVRDAIRFQESLGLEVVTDGEIRRLNFQDSFGAAVSGFAAGATTLRATRERVAGGKAMARFDMPDLHQHGPAVTRPLRFHDTSAGWPPTNSDTTPRMSASSSRTGSSCFARGSASGAPTRRSRSSIGSCEVNVPPAFQVR